MRAHWLLSSLWRARAAPRALEAVEAAQAVCASPCHAPREHGSGQVGDSRPVVSGGARPAGRSKRNEADSPGRGPAVHSGAADGITMPFLFL